MHLFKRKLEIPPVEAPASLPSTTKPRSSPNSYPNISTASPHYNRLGSKGTGDVYSRGAAELDKDSNDTLIPSVEGPARLPSGIKSRSSPNFSTASRGDAPNYDRSKGPGDVYSRGTAELDKDRNELFSGYNPTKSGSGRFFDDSRIKDDEATDVDDDDIERIKQQTRYVKQESVNTTRNALLLAREAEETGRNTLGRLVEQHEQMKETQYYLENADEQSNRAARNTDELKQLNRSIFIPVTKRKDWNLKKREVRERPGQANYDRTTGPGDNPITGESLAGGRNQLSWRSNAFNDGTKCEDDMSEENLDEEVSGNLDEILKMTRSLKGIGLEMGNELERQSALLDKLGEKTDTLNNKLVVNTDRLKKIK